jgi:Uma2 family endonuclease
MNVALRQRMSFDEFLAWEERQELRYEFDGFQPYAMVGGTAAHSTVQRNLVTALTNRLRGVSDPVVIFEVLSESTARVDHVTKNAEYRATASVPLEQDSQAATVFAGEGDRWVGSLLTGDAVRAMPEIGIEVPLAELYEGLDLSQSPSEATA